MRLLVGSFVCIDGDDGDGNGDDDNDNDICKLCHIPYQNLGHLGE